MHEPHSGDDLPAPSIRRWAPAWRSVLAHLVAIVIIVIIVDVIGRVAIAYLTSDPASQGLRTFLTSPGMGGVSAVAAASIAFAAVHRQLAHMKAVAREVAWWKSFEWATERALPMDTERTHMPRLWSIDLLTPMLSEATTDFQRRAAGGVTSRLADLLDAETTPSEPTDAEAIKDNRATDAFRGPKAILRGLANATESLLVPPRSSDVQATLARYVAASHDTQARSASAERLLYRLRAEERLRTMAIRRDWEIDIGLSAPTGLIAKLWNAEGGVIVTTGHPPEGGMLPPELNGIIPTGLVYCGVNQSSVDFWRKEGFVVHDLPIRSWNEDEIKALEMTIEVAWRGPSKRKSGGVGGTSKRLRDGVPAD